MALYPTYASSPTWTAKYPDGSTSQVTVRGVKSGKCVSCGMFATQVPMAERLDDGRPSRRKVCVSCTILNPKYGMTPESQAAAWGPDGSLTLTVVEPGVTVEPNGVYDGPY